MTQLATGTVELPSSPWFVTFGRAASAGCCPSVFLLWQRRRSA